MADIYQEAAESIVNADRAAAEEIAQRALDSGLTPADIMQQGFVKGIQEVFPRPVMVGRNQQECHGIVLTFFIPVQFPKGIDKEVDALVPEFIPSAGSHQQRILRQRVPGKC